MPEVIRVCRDQASLTVAPGLQGPPGDTGPQGPVGPQIAAAKEELFEVLVKEVANDESGEAD